MGKGIVEDYAALRVGSLISARYRRDGRARRQRAGLPPGVVDGLTRDEAGVPRLVDGSAALEVVAKMPGGRQRLSVAATLCHFGGSRLWFVCGCGRRCADLRRPSEGPTRAWRCRQCWDLLYETQVWGGREARRLSLARRLVKDAVWWGSESHRRWQATIRDEPGTSPRRATRRIEQMEAQHVHGALETARELACLTLLTDAPTPTHSPFRHITVVVRHGPIRDYVHPRARVVRGEHATHGPADVRSDGARSDAADGGNAVGRMAKDAALVEVEGEGLRRRALHAAMQLMGSADTRVALRSVDMALQLLTGGTDSRQGGYRDAGRPAR